MDTHTHHGVEEVEVKKQSMVKPDGHREGTPARSIIITKKNGDRIKVSLFGEQGDDRIEVSGPGGS